MFIDSSFTFCFTLRAKVLLAVILRVSLLQVDSASYTLRSIYSRRTTFMLIAFKKPILLRIHTYLNKTALLQKNSKINNARNNLTPASSVFYL